MEHCELPRLDPLDPMVLPFVNPKYNPWDDCKPTFVPRTRIRNGRVELIDGPTEDLATCEFQYVSVLLKSRNASLAVHRGNGKIKGQKRATELLPHKNCLPPATRKVKKRKLQTENPTVKSFSMLQDADGLPEKTNMKTKRRPTRKTGMEFSTDRNRKHDTCVFVLTSWFITMPRASAAPKMRESPLVGS